MPNGSQSDSSQSDGSQSDFRVSFDGQVAVVTGAGARADGIGNGRAAALLLAGAGAEVVAVDRDGAAAERTAEMIAADGGTAQVFVGDVTKEADNVRLAAAVADVGKPLGVLVNNVGIGLTGNVVDTSQKDWELVMRVNVDSMYQVSRQLIPLMAESGGGAIVNLSSIAAIRPRGLTAYSTSKGAVIALTTAMAVDHGRQGIRVNAVLPGPVWTPMVDRPDMTPERRERRKNASLLGLEGTGWDVGRAVVFLASDQARYITGQSLIVDGGASLWSAGR